MSKFATEIRNEIVSGTIQPGDFILPENALSEKYKLSRVSIRKVLAELVEEGLLEKIPGKGNRVKLPDGSAVRQTLRLAWFASSYEIDIVRRIIRQYEAKHPYVQVELMLLPEEKYVDNLIRMIEQGDGPDLFMISEWHVREWIESEKIGLLASYLPEGLDIERDSYAKIFDMFTYRGELLAVPFLFSPVVICYNEDLLVEAGVTDQLPIRDWDALLEIAQKCTKDRNGDGVTDQYGFCISASTNRWPVFVLQNDGSFFDRDGKSSNFSCENTVEALQYCIDFMYKHQVSPIYSHGSNFVAERLFVKERVAMILTTYYFMNEFRDQSCRWNILPLPKRKKPATLLLGGAIAINKNSDRRKVAQSLIDFMIGEEAQTLLKRHGCTIPMRRSVAENNELLDRSIHPENYNVFLEVLPYAYTLRELNLTQSQISLLHNELHLLWANIETPLEACRRIEKLLDQTLSHDYVSRQH
jgi:multiple sugar transport system substrate-binding protein